MKFERVLTGVAVAVLATAAFAAPACAQQTISNGAGTFSVGIGVNGELVNNGDGVGIRRNADGYDPTAGAPQRDSWGLAAGGAVAYADQNFFGAQNILSTNIVAGANSATATSLTSFGLTVVQNYSFVGGGNILRIDTAVTNTTLDAVTALFQRNIDWDIDPTPYNENVFGPSGAASSVVDSSYFGFENPDPDAAYAASCFGGCDETGDLGGGIKIKLGSLLSGATAHFSYFYGLNFAGGSVNDLIALGKAAGAAYLIAGQSSDGTDDVPATNSAFIGVAGVPEPATWAMLILGFFGLGAMVRRRRAALA